MKLSVFLRKYLIIFSVSCILNIFILFTPANANPLDNWHWRNPLPQGNILNGITYGNGTFVAIGQFGTILTSSDGASWTQRSSGTTEWLNGVTYGNGTFVAVGWGGYHSDIS